MALLNHSKGFIQTGLLLDRSGQNMKTALQLSRLMERGSNLWYVTCKRDNSFASLLMKGGYKNDLRLATLQSIGSKNETVSVDFDHPLQHNTKLLSKGLKQVASLHPATDDVLVYTNSEQRTIIYCKGVKASVLKKVIGDMGKYYMGSVPDFFPENGDTIACEDFILLGICAKNDYYEKNPTKSLERAIADSFYAGESCPPVYVIGSDNADRLGFYHLDLYVTYGGVDSGCHLFFVAEISDEMVEAFGDLAESKEYMKAQQHYLNHAAAQISMLIAGARVLRIAIMCEGNDRIYSFNNVLIERPPGRKPKCIMPRYVQINGLQTSAADMNVKWVENCHLVAREKVEEAGFCVLPLDIDVSISGQSSVGIHCMLAVLERGLT